MVAVLSECAFRYASYMTLEPAVPVESSSSAPRLSLQTDHRCRMLEGEYHVGANL